MELGPHGGLVPFGRSILCTTSVCGTFSLFKYPFHDLLLEIFGLSLYIAGPISL